MLPLSGPLSTVKPFLYSVIRCPEEGSVGKGKSSSGCGELAFEAFPTILSKTLGPPPFGNLADLSGGGPKTAEQTIIKEVPKYAGKILRNIANI